MNIASLVLRILPETRAEAEAALHALPGVECHHMSADGHLIVTVEDVPGAAMSDALIAVHRVPQVLAATLAYEHTDHAIPTIPITPITTIPTSRNLPCQEAQS